MTKRLDDETRLKRLLDKLSLDKFPLICRDFIAAFTASDLILSASKKTCENIKPKRKPVNDYG